MVGGGTDRLRRDKLNTGRIVGDGRILVGMADLTVPKGEVVMAEHAHYQCESCERVFCTDDARYNKMAEGDTCPSCHVAVVARLPDVLGGPPEMPPEIQRMFGAMANTMDFGNLLIAASRIYPYVSQDFTDVQAPLAAGAMMTPNDGRRAAAAVEVTLLMADLIVAHIRADAAKAASSEGSVADQFKPDDRPRDGFTI
jgi:hypothetical protein